MIDLGTEGEAVANKRMAVRSRHPTPYMKVGRTAMSRQAIAISSEIYEEPYLLRLKPWGLSE